MLNRDDMFSCRAGCSDVLGAEREPLGVAPRCLGSGGSVGADFVVID